MARRKWDFYETNYNAVLALRSRVPIHGVVYEPCNGLGAISRQFLDCVDVVTNDINPEMNAQTTGPAENIDWNSIRRKHQTAFSTPPPWIVTNPPFGTALNIVRPAVESGLSCAFLLRLSFLEPTRDPKDTNYRGEWLNEHQPSGIIVLPRYSYTGDGKTDSVTSAWLIWNYALDPAIQVVNVVKEPWVTSPGGSPHADLISSTPAEPKAQIIDLMAALKASIGGTK